MPKSILVTLRALLALLFAAAVAVQIAAISAANAVLAGAEAVGLGALIITTALCIEVVIVSAWMLVTEVQTESIFDENGYADRWVRAAIVTLFSASGVTAVGFAFLLISLLASKAGETATSAGSSDATLHVVLLVVVAVASLGSAALALLVLVMKRLLHTAMRQRSELAEVI